MDPGLYIYFFVEDVNVYVMDYISTVPITFFTFFMCLFIFHTKLTHFFLPVGNNFKLRKLLSLIIGILLPR